MAKEKAKGVVKNREIKTDVNKEVKTDETKETKTEETKESGVLVELISDCYIEEKLRKQGQTVKVSKSVAKRLIEIGCAI
jgi:hypothetical protein